MKAISSSQHLFGCFLIFLMSLLVIGFSNLVSKNLQFWFFGIYCNIKLLIFSWWKEPSIMTFWIISKKWQFSCKNWQINQWLNVGYLTWFFYSLQTKLRVKTNFMIFGNLLWNHSDLTPNITPISCNFLHTMKKWGNLQLNLQLGFWVAMTICISLQFNTFLWAWMLLDKSNELQRMQLTICEKIYICNSCNSITTM
jgi:hypothetical protein